MMDMHWPPKAGDYFMADQKNVSIKVVGRVLSVNKTDETIELFCAERKDGIWKKGHLTVSKRLWADSFSKGNHMANDILKIDNILAITLLRADIAPWDHDVCR